MDARDTLAALDSDNELESASLQRSSSLSLSQNSPSIPAEQDWLEAEDLDGERWVRAEDMDNMWGDAAVPLSHSNRVNNLAISPRSPTLLMHASQATPQLQPQLLDLDMQSGLPSISMPVEDTAEPSEPSPKRARLSSSPSPFKSSPRAHRTVIPVKPPPELPHKALACRHPSREETLLTSDPAIGSARDSEDDTGSSGDASGSMRQLHAPILPDASSPTSEGVVGSASGDDLLGSQDYQASSHEYGTDTDEESDISDGFEGIAAHICVNCTARIYAGDVICLDCGHPPAQDDELFDQRLSSQATPAPPQRVILAYDKRMTLHAEGTLSSHPERPDRVRAVMARLSASGLTDQCLPMPVREATAAEIAACHGPHQMARVANKTALAAADAMAGGPGRAHFSSDTYVNQHTLLCARLAAGACADVAAAVVRREAATGVAIVRPPGHHAESNNVMGFCFFNNAAIAARAAQAAGAERVLILDWDVHHGNGTQQIFESDPTVMYMSIHRHDRGMFYPGTGAAEATGTGLGQGCSVNVPWTEGQMGNGDYMAAFQHVLLPIAYEFNPSLVIISAGFDAALGDPIGGCKVTVECFAHMTAMLQPIAPLAVLLEGGYNLSATAAATEACLRVLLGQRPPVLPFEDRAPSASGLAVIQHVVRTQAQYWSCLRGLVPAHTPSRAPSPVRLGHRQIPRVNIILAGDPHSATVETQPAEDAQETSTRPIVGNSDSHGHPPCLASSSEPQCRKAGQAKAWPQSAKDLYSAGCHLEHAVETSEDGGTTMLHAGRENGDIQCHAAVAG
ncbi:hypothetical protein ABBQ32_006589 [Trebouxia sp. C0010 RCD-2024]